MRPVRHPGELRWETRLLGVIVATLVIFGIVAVYGASSLEMRGGEPRGMDRALVQVTGAALGGILLIIASRVDYYRWRQVAWPLLLVTLLLLLIPILPFTHAIAPRELGARRWIDLGPLRFQPSELARLSIIVWCAMLATKKGERVREFRKGVLPFISVLGLVFILVLLEPNLSMATLITLLGGIVLFAAGARVGHFLLLAAIAMVVGYQQIMNAQYRLARAITFVGGADIDPTGAGYQIKQSVAGFGSGRMFGVGLGEGQQKLGYLPEAETDFIFSTIGEEWGFAGVCVLIALYSTFCWLGFRIARTASDPFGQYLAIGLTAAVGVTAFMHMAVNTGLMPTTGLTLPFVSYGRSSQVVTLLAAGILINIGRMRGKPRAPVRASGSPLVSERA